MMAENEGDEGTALNQEQKDLLIKLFNVLDENGDGRLQVTEFQQLGYAMTGVMPSVEETRAQIRKADLDSDGNLDLDEWLTFSRVLATLPMDTFRMYIETYIKKLMTQREEDAKKREDARQ